MCKSDGTQSVEDQQLGTGVALDFSSVDLAQIAQIYWTWGNYATDLLYNRLKATLFCHSLYLEHQIQSFPSTF